MEMNIFHATLILVKGWMDDREEETERMAMKFPFQWKSESDSKAKMIEADVIPDHSTAIVFMTKYSSFFEFYYNLLPIVSVEKRKRRRDLLTDWNITQKSPNQSTDHFSEIQLLLKPSEEGWLFGEWRKKDSGEERSISVRKERHSWWNKSMRCIKEWIKRGE